MDSLKNWAAAFCVISVVCAFASFLVPKGSVKKAVNIVMTLFMLSVVIMPINHFSLSELTALFDARADAQEEFDDYAEELNDYLIESGKQVIKDHIAAELQGICNDAYSVYVDMEIRDDGNPFLTRIVITVSQNDAAKTIIIKSKIGSLTGVVPEVEIG